MIQSGRPTKSAFPGGHCEAIEFSSFLLSGSCVPYRTQKWTIGGGEMARCLDFSTRSLARYCGRQRPVNSMRKIYSGDPWFHCVVPVFHTFPSFVSLSLLGNSICLLWLSKPSDVSSSLSVIPPLPSLSLFHLLARMHYYFAGLFGFLPGVFCYCKPHSSSYAFLFMRYGRRLKLLSLQPGLKKI